jgi:hypothetical protein
LRPAEPLFGQAVIEFASVFTLQCGEQFPFHPALKVGAGLGGRYVELRRDRQCVAHDVQTL